MQGTKKHGYDVHDVPLNVFTTNLKHSTSTCTNMCT